MTLRHNSVRHPGGFRYGGEVRLRLDRVDFQPNLVVLHASIELVLIINAHADVFSETKPLVVLSNRYNRKS